MPSRRAASARAAGSPTATRRAVCRMSGSAQARTSTSGPTPAGSPMVTARTGNVDTSMITPRFLR